MNGSLRHRYALCRRVGRKSYHVRSAEALDGGTIREARSLARAPWIPCRTVWIIDRVERRVVRVVEVPPYPHEVTP